MTHEAGPQAVPVSGVPAAGRWALMAGGLPRTFWYLWTGSLINRLGSAVGPFLALYLTGSRGVSTAEAGLVLTAFGAGQAISQPIGGVLADRLGRRVALVSGLLSSAALLLAVGAATTLPALALAVFAYGLCLDAVRPAVQAAVADVVPTKDRARAYALNFWAINLGFSVAVPLGGFLASRGYWWLFAVDAATAVVFALVVVLRVPETRPLRVPGATAGSLREVLADRLLLALVLCNIGQAAVYMQAFSTLPLVVADDGLGEAAYGVALGLNGILIVALQPFVLAVLARQDSGRLLLVAGVVQGGGLALHGFADSLPEHMAAVAVWTVGEVLQAGLLSGLVADLSPAHLRGRYLGVFGASFGIAAFLAPLAGTQTLQHLGEPALWTACAVLGAVSGAGLLRVSAAAHRRATAVR